MAGRSRGPSPSPDPSPPCTAPMHAGTPSIQPQTGYTLGHGWGMRNLRLSLPPARRDSGATWSWAWLGNTWPRAVRNPRTVGLGCTRRWVWGENSAAGRPYAPLGETRGYPALGVGREPRLGPSLSLTRRGSRVCGTGHGERTLPCAVPIPHSEALRCLRQWAWGGTPPWAVPIPPSEGVGGIRLWAWGDNSDTGHPYPPLGGEGLGCIWRQAWERTPQRAITGPHSEGPQNDQPSTPRSMSNSCFN